MAARGLVVGVDVGGTNTDSVLLDTAQTGTQAVKASHKAPTTANVILGVQETLSALLDKSPANREEIAAIAIGTTHFINAIIERDASRLEKVAVLRLASYNFSAGTPPFADWPGDLKRLIYGHWAILPGGCNIDGTLIADIDDDAVREQAHVIEAKGLKNIVVTGIGSPTDLQHNQEQRVRNILEACFETSHWEVDITCSRDVAGMGLLARENAAILNSSILSFARRTIRAFMIAMRHVGLRCPLYLTSNTGHLLPLSEAARFPIKIFSSGATNSIRGAAFLVGSNIDQAGCVVVDIGGTSTDVGYLLKNGYPRLSKSYSDVAGVKINLETPSVESIALGGGSVLHINPDRSQISVGPQSVALELSTRALCFGGSTATATDVVVASGGCSLGTCKVDLEYQVTSGAKAKIKKMLEAAIDHSKLFPEPCPVILVGGGSILCPEQLIGVDKIIVPEHAGVANAIGAAMAQISASSHTIWEGSDIQAGINAVQEKAIQEAIEKGGIGVDVTILNVEAAGVPYIQDQTAIKVEVAMPADHAKLRQENYGLADSQVEDAEGNVFEELKRHEIESSEPVANVDFRTYRPRVTREGLWCLSRTDLRFLEVGCYILGSGGGGSPYAVSLELRQLLSEGETISMVSCADLKDEAVIPSVAGVGSPAVGNERPGGDGIIHALDMLSKELKVDFTHLLSTEIGGSNGMAPLLLGSSKYYNLPSVDGDLMGRAYPAFEMVSTFVSAGSVNALLPVTLCDGTGRNYLISGGRTDESTPGKEIRDACVAMGFACGAAGVPLSGTEMRTNGIPNTHSLAWRIGRVVCMSQQSASLSTLPEALIEECGGSQSAKRLFQGKIRGVESVLTNTAHSLGKVTIEALSEEEMESDADRASEYSEVVVPFINENLAVIGKINGSQEEVVLATVPDLIFLLDVSTGENIGTQEYRYGVKVTVMAMAPHPVWTSTRGLEIGGPKAFDLPYEYNSTLQYTQPRSVIDEFRSLD